MNESMVEWMEGWIGNFAAEWMGVQLDGWMGRWVNIWMSGCMGARFSYSFCFSLVR